MGNIYRFIEPVLLLMLKEKGPSCGYDLSEGLSQYALTDAQIERAALYRTLRTLEQNGYLSSAWNTDHAGPARRVYELTTSGEEHLLEWAQVMERLGEAMSAFSKKAHAHTSRAKAKRTR
jgi:DNA-binding PadR family transcriptional regulator